MHIVDGVLSAPVLIAGSVCAVAGVARGLADLDAERIPQAGLMSAVFFVAALIHVPVGPASAHLMLTGLMGLLLGWAAFPAILVGLVLQAAFFGFGGLTVLGVNTLNLALPAVLVGVLARALLGRMAGSPRGLSVSIIGALMGALSFALSALLVAAALALSGSAFVAAAQLMLVAQIPVLVVEALMTAAVLRLLLTVRPELVPAVEGRVPAVVERPQEA
jgi:cobalt/nickel transport system permease protein